MSDTIICGHVHSKIDDLELNLLAEADRTRTRRYWIGPGKFADISREETVRRIRLSFSWATWFSNTNFIEVERERDALHKIYFASKERVGQIVGDGLSYFAVQWPSNSWHFNQDINVLRWRPERFVVEAVNLHEFGHTLGFKHTNGPNDLMHANVLGWYPTPQELVRFQNRLGKSPGFWAVPQQEIGKQIREKSATRNHYIDIRSNLQLERSNSRDMERRSFITNEIRSVVTPEIQKLHSEISQLTAEWHVVRNLYRNIPGAR